MDKDKVNFYKIIEKNEHIENLYGMGIFYNVVEENNVCNLEHKNEVVVEVNDNINKKVVFIWDHENVDHV